jgi:hypothetical protein
MAPWRASRSSRRKSHPFAEPSPALALGVALAALQLQLMVQRPEVPEGVVAVACRRKRVNAFPKE